MAARRGRPRASGKYITLQLNDSCLEIMGGGVALLSERQGKAPNRSAWFRGLIDHALGTACTADVAAGCLLPKLVGAMDRDKLEQQWPVSWFEQPTPHQATMKLEDSQRMLLRQFECHVQALDWAREMYRNEVAQLLIAAHGPAFNQTF
ncbi:hypothetical protein [Pseudomonas aeruginosa]|uniref:hypothetical protein n=1 Tax=Pseudomonas aeruginosa TaxID=287 RepID=UPI002E2BC2A0|nr:hypothetical protein [Pseudomonas aeruginosa]